MTRRLPLFLLACAALLLAAAWCYRPGLSGGFLFDDYANLPALGAKGPIDNAPAFWRYITSGRNDPVGRPLSMLSFLIDAHDWPADPAPFLRTNLLLHLLNGTLLALLLRRLGRTAGYVPARADLAAAIGAGLWLLHPLFVSTTLYIVQREAILPATTVLLGLHAWLHGRERLHTGRALTGAAWVVAGLGGGTLLGVLCKPTGALLPLYALLVEYLLLRHLPVGAAPAAAADTQPRSGKHTPPRPAEAAARVPPYGSAGFPAHSARTYRWTMAVLAWLPTAAILGYLLRAGWLGITHGIGALRPWTLGQRLLTEPRVLIDYLGLLWLPRPYTSGLFNDQIQASTGLLAPPSTLAAILAIAALLGLAWWLRRRQPVLALAVAFYFAGHLVESTTIALELYFEHRNYVPAMLIFWPLALWLGDDATMKAARRALALVLLAGLALMTHAGASLWGNQTDQALLWARLNPASPRAQAFAAQAEMQRGRPDLAITRLTPPLRTRPAEVQLALNLLAARCAAGGVSEADLLGAEQALRTTRNPGSLLMSWFERTIDMAKARACPGIDFAVIQRLLDAALANPDLGGQFGPHQDLLHIEGELALAMHDASRALANFNRALALNPRVEVALQQAALFGSAGLPRLGLAHLDYYARIAGHAVPPGPGMPTLHARVLERQRYWEHELTRMRTNLQQDADRQAAASDSTHRN
ncbi:MAG: tetratricopeptide repeat protein [Mizugakiibacter sp.]|uniref:tetratricopeptide repeat protein n=1 Tax=Mizugakiibacter sp. TaxID=1972610 RepID=UPI0031C3573E|nr:tetratricopeptide repeat protein [Xanthomonadaceae bacterium]